MTTVLVTGSDGLIGSRLCSILEKTGKDVVRFDIKFPKKHCDYGDILDLDYLREKLKECVGIVHLAAVSRVVWGEKNPEHCWQTNVIGTQNIIKTALESPTKPWVFYASSREIYGQKKELPVKIDAEYDPLNIYARSKVAAEKEFLQSRQAGLCTAIIRYSSVYGSVDDHKTRVVPAFCRATANGESLRIDGVNNTLDFTHLDDVVAGTMLVINQLEDGNNTLPPLHLTTGIPTTLLQLAKLASDAAGRKLNFIEASSRQYDVSRFYGDVSETTQLLGWKAKIPIKQGVYDLVQKFKSTL